MRQLSTGQDNYRSNDLVITYRKVLDSDRLARTLNGVGYSVHHAFE